MTFLTKYKKKAIRAINDKDLRAVMALVMTGFYCIGYLGIFYLVLFAYIPLAGIRELILVWHGTVGSLMLGLWGFFFGK